MPLCINQAYQKEFLPGQGYPFHPHLTIARVNNPRQFEHYEREVDKLLSEIDFTFKVDRVWLLGAYEKERQIPFYEWTMNHG